MTHDERALATIERITELRPIEGADSIQTARVRGWDVVVRIGEFEVDDLVVYFEIDSFLPLDDPHFTFLAPRGARKNPEGVEGHVLKTAKLKGQYSQGLVLSLDDFPEIVDATSPALFEDDGNGDWTWKIGADVTRYIRGLEKWDPPIPAELAGSAKGAFPSEFRKTDEERVQNMSWLFEDDSVDAEYWVATEKIDGSSMTIYVKNGEVGVASRNWDIEETSHNSMWKLAHESGVIDHLKAAVDGTEIAVQGEIFGPGIQGNPLQVKDVQFRVFTLQINREEIPRELWPEWLTDIAVPVHKLPYPGTIEEALEQVDNLKSLINPQRPVEGVVWRNTRAAKFDNGARASWKSISQRYLLKHDR